MSATGQINNKTTGELSDKLPNLFVPSGITFSIWGLIYALLFLFIIYQAVDSVKKDADGTDYLNKTGWFFVLSNIANLAWIFTWHYELVPASLLFMMLLLISLLAIYLRLGIGEPRTVMSRREKLFFQLPFSVYLGWITVATIANVTAVLVWAGVEPYTQTAVVWTALVIIVAAVIAGLVSWTRKDIAYSLVIVWALIGILIKRLDPSHFMELTVATTAGIAALAVTMVLVTKLIRGRITSLDG
jgi:hypothetical protein